MDGSEVYLKTRQVADALGVSVSTIKRWVDVGAMDATRTMGRHRLIPLSAALSFARRERFPVEALLSMGGDDPVPAGDDRVCEALAAALESGRGREAAALIGSAHRSMGGAAALGDRVIRPVMERIGRDWMVGTCDVFQEHQATQIVSSALVALIAKAAASSVPSRWALAASPEGDPYTLAGLLGELTLREVGWNVRNFGGNLPLRSLAAATRRYRPGLIFLSVGSIADRPRFLLEYAYFYEAANQVGAGVIVGGRALDSDLRSKLVYASFGERLAHLAEFARRLLPADPPEANSTPT